MNTGVQRRLKDSIYADEDKQAHVHKLLIRTKYSDMTYTCICGLDKHDIVNKRHYHILGLFLYS